MSEYATDDHRRFDTVADSTKARYTHVANRLTDRYTREMGLAWREDLDAFARWLSALAQDVSSASWRQYRAALKYVLADQAPPSLFATLDQVHAKQPVAERGTSGRRPRKLPDKDLTTLIEQLASVGRSRCRALVACWLVAGRAVGLRPSEWWGAHIEGAWLIVKNAKYAERHDGTSERAFAEQRHLYLAALSDAERIAVKQMLRYSAEEPFQEAYDRARQMLYRTQRALWPRRGTTYALYSARHQFVADAKASGFSETEVAAMLGHASEETAQQHYGRRVSGSSYRAVAGTVGNASQVARTHSQAQNAPPTHPAFRILPAQEDVDKVAELNAARAQRAEHSALTNPD